MSFNRMSNATEEVFTLSPTIELMSIVDDEDEIINPWLRVLAIVCLVFFVPCCCYLHIKQERANEARHELERIADIQRFHQRNRLQHPATRKSVLAKITFKKVRSIDQRACSELLFHLNSQLKLFQNTDNSESLNVK